MQQSQTYREGRGLRRPATRLCRSSGTEFMRQMPPRTRPSRGSRPEPPLPPPPPCWRPSSISLPSLRIGDPSSGLPALSSVGLPIMFFSLGYA